MTDAQLNYHGFIRGSPAHTPPVERHNTPLILHVTLSLADKKIRLDRDEVHSVFRYCWKKADFWKVGYYMIMPDHVHFFCAPGQLPCSPIRRWCGYWKRQVGMRLESMKGAWLSDCWDTQMRDREHYERKLAYLKNNPVRAGLVTDNADWLFQGKMISIPWI